MGSIKDSRAASKDAEPVAPEQPGERAMLLGWLSRWIDGNEDVDAVARVKRIVEVCTPSTGGEGGVKVKELEWIDYSWNVSEAKASPLGLYAIVDFRYLRLNSEQIGFFPTLPDEEARAAAKAAAQADYERRSRTAIEPVAASPGVGGGRTYENGHEQGVKDALDALDAVYEAQAPEGADYSQIVQAIEALLAAAPPSPAPSPAGGDVMGALVELDGVTMTPAAAARRIADAELRVATLEAEKAESEWHAIGDWPYAGVPARTPLIVSYREAPYPHLFLHAQVAYFDDHDLDWTSATSGEPIIAPTHWRHPGRIDAEAEPIWGDISGLSDDEIRTWIADLKSLPCKMALRELIDRRALSSKQRSEKE